ncbi:hypothetical protein [Streptomyces soliscabiei]|uniref:hypothetical protein n=1 Tax=Streptomyces soliscabiei TaxID=588897 RepID=UPI0029B74CDB|nr:hypothetical protein [Streptomyces sp. NY05-11A]MDX2679281.1 hypothetical protein [Streptomyces sp. NY05-11A]
MDDLLAPPGYYTARDAQRALGISAGALRNLVYRGQLTRTGGTERHPWYTARDVAAIAAKRAARSAA